MHIPHLAIIHQTLGLHTQILVFAALFVDGIASLGSNWSRGLLALDILTFIAIREYVHNSYDGQVAILVILAAATLVLAVMSLNMPVDGFISLPPSLPKPSHPSIIASVILAGCKVIMILATAVVALLPHHVDQPPNTVDAWAHGTQACLWAEMALFAAICLGVSLFSYRTPAFIVVFLIQVPIATVYLLGVLSQPERAVPFASHVVFFQLFFVALVAAAGVHRTEWDSETLRIAVFGMALGNGVLMVGMFLYEWLCC
ncbi:hypothetical protein CspHIS471_0108520 [Cutaneotrichosporon sp. HIS471]|nr:hypothetical protein CspHIS471_0108520 [Cutaneotrichosporon sp. HIS471]